MKNDFTQSLLLCAHAVSGKVPARTGEKVFLHLVSEIGELAEEANIHSGELYKSPGVDGVVGEACDVINCLADLVWVRLREMTPEAIQKESTTLAAIINIGDLDVIPVQDFSSVKAEFARTISDLRTLQEMSLGPCDSALKPQEQAAVAYLLDVTLKLLRASTPQMSSEDVLEIYQSKCDKWLEKAAGSNSTSHNNEPLVDQEKFEAFRSTRREMTSREFGELIQDRMWDDCPEVPFLVYEDSYWIERTGDEDYSLIIGNLSWATGPDYDLLDLERELFKYSI